MKNNKSIFSPKLMMEGFRQCKMIGILALIIMVLGAILLPAGTAIYISDSEGMSYAAEAMEAPDVNPLLILVIPAIALMTLVLFHFLDSRSASDLYHALPHKRITLYISYTASLILWMLVLLFASTLCSIITCLIAGKYIVLIMSTVLPYMFSMLLITLLVIGGMLTAINLTGTVFTNIVLSGIILFLPRLCFAIAHSAIFDSIPFLTNGISGSSIFSNDSNLLFGMFSLCVDMNSVSETDILRPDWHSIIYTFILAAVYLVIAGILFCRRSSESAGQSAPTRMHQHVYRIVITMVYCVVVTALLVNDISDIRGFDAESIFMYCVLYLIAALIYFVYELITTKKWKNLITSLPGLALVAGLNLGLAVGLGSVRNYVIDERPKADEISSVSIGVGNLYSDSDNWWNYSYYAGKKNSEVKITDNEVISLVSYYLDENIMTWKDSEYSYYNKYHSSDGKYTSYTVIINTGSKELNRIVMIPEEDSDKIMSIIETIPEYIKNWQNPPKPIADTIAISGFFGADATSEDAEKIFDIYCQELKELPFKDLYNAFTYGGYNLSIVYTFSENGYTKELDCPVYSDIMPKTTAAYYEMIYNKQAEDRNNFENMINSGKYESINFDINGKNENNENVYYYNNTSENLKDLCSYISKYIKDEPIQTDGLYATIWLYPSDYNNDTVGFAVSLDKNILKDSYFKEHFNMDSDRVY